MKKTTAFMLATLFFAAVPAFTQTQVDYTNQFFAAKTAGGKCFVFIYSDNFTFVNITASKRDTVKIIYNFEGLDDVFIAGNIFFTKRRNIINLYDLTQLTDPANNGRRIDDILIEDQLENISNVALYGDTLYYTKNGDTKIYSYSPAEKKETAVPGIAVTPGRFLNYVEYVPMKEKRNAEYQAARTRINEAITRYSRIGTGQDIRAVGDMLARLPANLRTETGVYEEGKKYFSGLNPFDRNAFDTFLMLAEINGKKREAQADIQKIRTASSSLARSTINDYYGAVSRAAGFTPAVLAGEFAEYDTTKIKPLEDALKSNWGTVYEKKKRDFDSFSGKRKAHAWQTGGTQNSQYTANKGKIKSIDAEINGLLEGSSFSRRQLNIERQYLMKLFEAAEFDPGVLQLDNDTVSLINGIGKRLIDVQNKVYDESSGDLTSSYDGLIAAKNGRSSVEVNFNTRKRAAEEDRDRLLNALVSGMAAKYRTEIYDQINQNPTLGIYETAYIDYCIIGASEQKINGFKNSATINMADFSNNQNNAGENYRLVKPAGYPVVNITGGNVFFLASKTQIQAFDTTKPNILANRPPPLDVKEGIFYMVKSDSAQYVVTNAGDLLLLGIEGGRITRTGVGRVSARDTVLVTDGVLYILSPDGTVKGTSGRVNSFKIKACNAGETYTVSLSGRGFEVRQ